LVFGNFQRALVGSAGRKARFGGFLRLAFVGHLIVTGALLGAVLFFFSGQFPPPAVKKCALHHFLRLNWLTAITTSDFHHPSRN